MNIVVIKHFNDSSKYIFKVPDGVVLDAGTFVACDTVRGYEQPGICVTSSFEADPAIICPMWGTAPERMRRVVSVLRTHMLEWPDEEKLPFSDFDDE